MIIITMSCGGLHEHTRLYNVVDDVARAIFSVFVWVPPESLATLQCGLPPVPPAGGAVTPDPAVCHLVCVCIQEQTTLISYQAW